MTTEHPITPPLELIEQWKDDWENYTTAGPNRLDYIATEAARWGADQELEACCQHLRDHQWGFVGRPDGTKVHTAVDLQLARRPKPPSLKEQALEALANLNGECLLEGFECPEKVATIRRALEALPDE